MNAGQLKIGRWYYASYGFDMVQGQCVAIADDAAILRFRWGGPFRTDQYVGLGRVIAEGEDPRLFGLVAWVKRAASAIEAGTAETAQTGSVHESAVAKPDAQPLSGAPHS